MISTEIFFASIEVIISIIITAAVPWAFIMERRLARIEIRISNGFADDIQRIRTNSDRLSDTMRNHEGRLIKLEVHSVDDSK